MAGEPVGKLVGWKEIADYLGISPRTVQRWEQEKALPVRRVPGSNGHSVFADAQELDCWLASGELNAAKQPAVFDQRLPTPEGAAEKDDGSPESGKVRLLLKRRPFLRVAVPAGLAAVLLLGAGLKRAHSAIWRSIPVYHAVKPAAGVPFISSVSAIAPRPDQVIVIKGHALGSYTYYANGDTPFIAIRDKTARWAAGRIMPQNWDEVTLNVADWTDTEVVVTGFAGAYGQHWWKLNPGDQIEVAVWNPQTNAGPALYELKIASPQSAQKR